MQRMVLTQGNLLLLNELLVCTEKNINIGILKKVAENKTLSWILNGHLCKFVQYRVMNGV